MVSGVQQIKPLWTALGPEKAKALPAFHAFSGADNTGRFARIGKATWFKLFLESDDDLIRALCMLCDDTDVTEDFMLSLRWSGVSARGTAHLIVARASQITYLAQIFVKTTKTHTTRIVIQMMTVMTNAICLI